MFREGGNPWWNVFPELKARGYQWVQKLNREMIPTDSATGVAMHDSTTKLGPVQNGTVASARFTAAAKGSHFDEVFIESAVRLGSRGWLPYSRPAQSSGDLHGLSDVVQNFRAGAAGIHPPSGTSQNK